MKTWFFLLALFMVYLGLSGDYKKILPKSLFQSVSGGGGGGSSGFG